MKDMLKEEKTRVIVFSAVSLLSVILVVWLSWGICDMTAVSPIDYDNIGEIYVDGADFTSCAMLGAGLVNGLMLMIYFGAAVIYALLAAVGAALSGVLLRVVMLRRAANIGAAELSLTRRIFIAVSITQAVVPAIIATGYIIVSGSPFGLISLLMCWQYPLLMGLIYIKKLKGLAHLQAEIE